MVRLGIVSIFVAVAGVALVGGTAQSAVTAFGCATSTQDPTFAAIANDCPNPNPNGPGGSGSGTSDLARGQLKAAATAYGFLAPPGTGTFADFGQVNNAGAGASLNETITIQGDLTGITDIRLSMRVRGSISGPASCCQLATFTLTGLSSGVYKDATFSLDDFAGNIGDDLQIHVADFSMDFVQVNSLEASNVDIDVAFLLPVDDDHRTISISASLGLTALPSNVGELIVDFGHTVNLGLTLPGALGFISNSGVFLTLPQDGEGNPVPEPSTLALLATGALVLWRRSRRPMPGFDQCEA